MYDKHLMLRIVSSLIRQDVLGLHLLCSRQPNVFMLPILYNPPELA
jgi:hypothetical protein